MDRPRGDLFIVSSPSGGGKTTLIRRLLAEPPGAPLEEFQRMVGLDEFLEHNEVHDNIYGTSKAEVLPRLAAGEDVILDIDVQGARDVRKVYPEAVMIFIVPSSREELERRLKLRGLDREESIRKRLINASREIQEAVDYQYVIVNDDLDRATLELQSVVRARRLTPARQAERLERIRREFR